MRHTRILLVLLSLMFWDINTEAQIQSGSLLWSYQAPSMVLGCPAIAPDGTIYLGTSSGLCAITNAGSNKWTFPATQSYYSSPAIASDGTIYWGDANANVFAINPDGSQKWKVSVPGNYSTSPAIATDGTVYFVASGILYAFSPAGLKLWQFANGAGSVTTGPLSPVIGPDGVIYIGSGNQTFYAINRDGSLRWQLRTYGPCGDAAALGRDGVIYFTGNVLVSASANGTQNWYEQTEPFTGSSPAVGPDGTIYIADAQYHSLYAVDPGGKKIWQSAYGPSGIGFPTTVPAIAGDGMIYYSSSNSVFAISQQGAIQWIFGSPFTNSPPTKPTGVSPAIGPDGTVYAAFGDVLYALKGGTNGLATAPWPMYRQNLRHTGRVENPSLAPPKKRADANFDIQLAGEIGQQYSVESTSNFLNWIFVTNFVATSLPMTISDLTATNKAARFYRATTP